MKRIFILLLFLCSLLFIFSCTPERQLNRLRVYHPEMFKSSTITDTVGIPGLKFDTTFKIIDFFELFEMVKRKPKNLSYFPFIKTQSPDTFNIEKQTLYGHNKTLKIQIIRDQENLKVSGELPADTIYKEIQVEQFQTCERKHIEDFVKYAVWSLIGLAVLLILIFIVVGLIKRGIL